MAIIDTRRISDTDVEQGLVVGDVKGKDAIIFDDEISTGTTIMTSVETLEKAGARKIYVATTHPALSEPAVKDLKRLRVEEVVATNTVQVPNKKKLAHLKFLSLGTLRAEPIKRIHSGESVGALFT